MGADYSVVPPQSCINHKQIALFHYNAKSTLAVIPYDVGSTPTMNYCVCGRLQLWASQWCLCSSKQLRHHKIIHHLDLMVACPYLGALWGCAHVCCRGGPRMAAAPRVGATWPHSVCSGVGRTYLYRHVPTREAAQLKKLFSHSNTFICPGLGFM